MFIVLFVTQTHSEGEPIPKPRKPQICIYNMHECVCVVIFFGGFFTIKAEKKVGQRF